MTAGTIEQRVEHAILAWEEGSRRRRLGNAAERVADAVLAAGGIVMADATMSLGLGLPAGRSGFAIGASLASAGFAWMIRGRARRTPVPQRALPVRVARPLPEWIVDTNAA